VRGGGASQHHGEQRFEPAVPVEATRLELERRGDRISIPLPAPR
jgi:hypothetical protein